MQISMMHTHHLSATSRTAAQGRDLQTSGSGLLAYILQPRRPSQEYFMKLHRWIFLMSVTILSVAMLANTVFSQLTTQPIPVDTDWWSKCVSTASTTSRFLGRGDGRKRPSILARKAKQNGRGGCKIPVLFCFFVWLVKKYTSEH